MPSFASNFTLRLRVDLDAVARNWLFLKSRLAAGADAAAVVKANAYGLGADAVSRALFRQGCRHFFTARVGEALGLSTALPEGGAPGQDSAIYVLDGLSGISAGEFAASGLIPVLNDRGDVAAWAAEAVTRGKKLPAILHIDTGMNRLGLTAQDVAALAADPMILNALDIRYVMSHLACADDAGHEMNTRQLAAFQTAARALGRTFRLSLANSGGILLGPDYHFDLVRPGCGLYGINPTNKPQNPMQGVVKYEARILQTREIDSPETVGYGAGYRAAGPVKCATLSIGYADGYLRSLEDGGRVFISGEACPVIGRVSMDTVVVDVSHVKTQPVTGDWAEIIGPQQSVDDVARQAGTIGYEILTSLGARAAREYTGAVAAEDERTTA